MVVGVEKKLQSNKLIEAVKTEKLVEVSTPIFTIYGTLNDLCRSIATASVP